MPCPPFSLTLRLFQLDLSDNRLSGGLNNLSQCPLLATLILSGNRIKDLAALQPLVWKTCFHSRTCSAVLEQVFRALSQAAMESLHALDLFENDVTQTDNYRLKIFELLPHLQYLDGEDRCVCLLKKTIRGDLLAKFTLNDCILGNQTRQ